MAEFHLAALVSWFCGLTFKLSCLNGTLEYNGAIANVISNKPRCLLSMIFSHLYYCKFNIKFKMQLNNVNSFFLHHHGLREIVMDIFSLFSNLL